MVHKGRRKRIKPKKTCKKREHVKFVSLFTGVVRVRVKAICAAERNGAG